MSRAGSIASRSRSARGFQAMRMGGFQTKEKTYSRPCAPALVCQRTGRSGTMRSFLACRLCMHGQPAACACTHTKQTCEADLYLTEGGTIVDGGRLGDEADAGGILGNLGDAEPLRGVAAGLLVGSRPHGEGEQHPEPDDLPRKEHVMKVSAAASCPAAQAFSSCASRYPAQYSPAHSPRLCSRCDVIIHALLPQACACARRAPPMVRTSMHCTHFCVEYTCVL